MDNQRVAVYIDGFNLYFGMHSKYGRRYLWLDLHRLGLSFLTGGQTLVKVAYFTASVRNDPPAQASQTIYLNALRATGGVEIIKGRFQSKQRTCHECGHSHTVYEEKETDVSLATALVEDAANDVYDRAIIVSADSDLGPAVRAVKRLRASARVIAAFPPNRTSGDLRAQVHGVFAIGRDKLHDAQLPIVVPEPDSSDVHTRPSRWT